MKARQKHSRQAIQFILDRTGLTQRQLAELVGASLDGVKGWTRKTNPSPVSEHFRRNIFYQIGATIKPDGSVKAWDGRMPFSGTSYRVWRRRFCNDDQAKADNLADQCCNAIKLLFRASLPTNPTQTSKLPAVWSSLVGWMEQAADNFNLRQRCFEISQKEHPGKQTVKLLRR